MTRKQRLGELLALFAGPMMCGDWSKNQQAQHQLKKLEDDYIFLIAFQEIIPIEKLMELHCSVLFTGVNQCDQSSS